MAEDYDWRVDAYRAWLYWCAWNAAKGDQVEADRLWREWLFTHRAPAGE